MDTEVFEFPSAPPGRGERRPDRARGAPTRPASVPSATAAQSTQPAAQRACGYGKVILLGEHAVVYGSHAIAAPIPLAMRARVQDAPAGQGVSLSLIEGEASEHRAPAPAVVSDVVQRTVELILTQLGLRGHALHIRVVSSVPRAMGLGSSAAFAVAVIRALDWHFKLELDDAQVNLLAFRCEALSHGTPSGIDNTVATYGEMVLYQRGEQTREVSQIQPLKVSHPLPLVIGVSGRRSLTAATVASVRRAWQQHPARYEAIFGQIDHLVLQGVQALKAEDWPRLGALMDSCHAQLQHLQVSSRELDALVRIAHENGAMGAKLTGGGRGGSIIALCPVDRDRVAQAMRAAGYQALTMDLG